MPTIVMTRIDSRLIHGQVATQWNRELESNLILVANDTVAEDKMRQGLMDMASPTGVETRYFSIQETIDKIGDALPEQKIFLFVESPEDALALVEGGVPIQRVNVGNMSLSEGKRQISTSVAVDDKDIETFKKLRELNVDVFIQRVPSSELEDTSSLFE